MDRRERESSGEWLRKRLVGREWSLLLSILSDEWIGERGRAVESG